MEERATVMWDWQKQMYGAREENGARGTHLMAFWDYSYVLQKRVTLPDWVPLKMNFPGSILSMLADNFFRCPTAVALGEAVNDYSLFIFPETLSFTYICHNLVLSGETKGAS